MKTYPLLTSVALLILSGSSPAQQGNSDHLVFGLYVLTPSTTGTVDGPETVIEQRPGVSPQIASNAFSSNVMLGLSSGVRIDQLNTSFHINYFLWVEVHRPDLQEGAEIDLQIRYWFWRYGLVSLSSIISLKKDSYSQNGGMFNSAYVFSNHTWLPGIGLGANFSVFHGEFQLRGWPRTIIAYAHQPNGLPPNPYGQASYDTKPVYLNYAISLALGFEFDVFSF